MKKKCRLFLHFLPPPILSFKLKKSYLCWDVVNLAPWAAPQILGWNGRADADLLQPKRQGKPFALEEIIIFGSAGERNLALRLQYTIGTAEFVLCLAPGRTHRLGLKRAFRANNGWKALPFQQWEMWNSIPTLTCVTREPPCGSSVLGH